MTSRTGIIHIDGAFDVKKINEECYGKKRYERNVTKRDNEPFYHMLILGRTIQEGIPESQIEIQPDTGRESFYGRFEQPVFY